MSKLIEFTKIEATGNDFIFIDGRTFDKKLFTPAAIRKMCSRHFGIGADGLIFVSDHPKGAFEMTIYNSDGLEANMCANGSRGAVLFAMTAGFTGCDERLDFQAADGIHQAIIYSENDIETEVRYQLPENMQDLSALKLPKNMTAEGLVNTGVPHLVINTADSPEHIDVKNLGRKLRYDPMFGAAGTNVNFIHVESDNNFSIRSYERGIEDETLSCGTGITAAALLFMRKKAKKEEEIIVNSRGGQLKVRIESGRLYLRGAANIVYVGRIALD